MPKSVAKPIAKSRPRLKLKRKAMKKKKTQKHDVDMSRFDGIVINNSTACIGVDVPEDFMEEMQRRVDFALNAWYETDPSKEELIRCLVNHGISLSLTPTSLWA